MNKIAVITGAGWRRTPAEALRATEVTYPGQVYGAKAAPASPCASPSCP